MPTCWSQGERQRPIGALPFLNQCSLAHTPPRACLSPVMPRPLASVRWRAIGFDVQYDHMLIGVVQLSDIHFRESGNWIQENANLSSMQLAQDYLFLVNRPGGTLSPG